MQLFLDSANMKEIKEVMEWDIVNGLTTTPTFMARDGVTNVDDYILELAATVPELQIEALGETAEDIVTEVGRLTRLGLDIQDTVFKIPMSLEGIKACSMLANVGYKVNMHLIYTVQQAYLATQAGAEYVCPLVGRLQDQGHDALGLIKSCMNMVNGLPYEPENRPQIMFSSVRHMEHVRNAIEANVDVITVPYKVLKQMFENNLTELGTQQFIRDTRLTTLRVKNVMKESLPTIGCENKLKEAIVTMTSGGLGCIMVQYQGTTVSIFTDGDLRRAIAALGVEALEKEMKHFSQHAPIMIDENESLGTAAEMFKHHKIDNIIVTREGTPVGILDIQNL